MKKLCFISILFIAGHYPWSLQAAEEADCKTSLLDTFVKDRQAIIASLGEVQRADQGSELIGQGPEYFAATLSLAKGNITPLVDSGLFGNVILQYFTQSKRLSSAKEIIESWKFMRDAIDYSASFGHGRLAAELDLMISYLPSNLPVFNIQNAATLNDLMEQYGLSRPQYIVLSELMHNLTEENRDLLRLGFANFIAEASDKKIEDVANRAVKEANILANTLERPRRSSNMLTRLDHFLTRFRGPPGLTAPRANLSPEAAARISQWESEIERAWTSLPLKREEKLKGRLNYIKESVITSEDLSAGEYLYIIDHLVPYRVNWGNEDSAEIRRVHQGVSSTLPRFLLMDARIIIEGLKNITEVAPNFPLQTLHARIIHNLKKRSKHLWSWGYKSYNSNVYNFIQRQIERLTALQQSSS